MPSHTTRAMAEAPGLVRRPREQSQAEVRELLVLWGADRISQEALVDISWEWTV